jgi:hypothetical protein
MNRIRSDLGPAEMESLLAVERELVLEPAETRNRAIQRARASLPSILPVRHVSRSPGPQRLRIGQAAAAAVMLTALCALAFHAGYRIKDGSPAAPARVPARTPSVAVPSVPAAPSASSLPADPEPPVPEPRRAMAKPVRPALSAAEAYAAELRVLQPAQRAVARQDFASALVAIGNHQRRFPSGRLAEEREALRVKALLGLGRAAEAERAGVAFGKRFPESALVGRIDKMLSHQ